MRWLVGQSLTPALRLRYLLPVDHVPRVNNSLSNATEVPFNWQEVPRHSGDRWACGPTIIEVLLEGAQGSIHFPIGLSRRPTLIRND